MMKKFFFIFIFFFPFLAVAQKINLKYNLAAKALARDNGGIEYVTPSGFSVMLEPEWYRPRTIQYRPSLFYFGDNIKSRVSGKSLGLSIRIPVKNNLKLEAGGFRGEYDAVITKTEKSGAPILGFLLTQNPLVLFDYSSKTTEIRQNNVKMYGARFGLVLHENLFTFIDTELSCGIVLRSSNLRKETGWISKQISPYLRVCTGLSVPLKKSAYSFKR